VPPSHSQLSRTQLKTFLVTSAHPKVHFHHKKKQHWARIGSTANRTPVGFSPLWRLQTGTATYTRVTTPSCAPPPGFLNLLTFYSAPAASALFHAESASGVEALRGFPLPVAATAFTALCPFSLYKRCSKDEALAPLRRTIPRQRPRERYLDTVPKNDASAPPPSDTKKTPKNSLRTPRNEQHKLRDLCTWKVRSR